MWHCVSGILMGSTWEVIWLDIELIVYRHHIHINRITNRKDIDVRTRDHRSDHRELVDSETPRARVIGTDKEFKFLRTSLLRIDDRTHSLNGNGSIVDESALPITKVLGPIDLQSKSRPQIF